LPWQRGSVGEKCDWQHSMAHSRQPFYGRKNFAELFYANRFKNPFCLKFRCSGNEGRSVKNSIDSIRWPIFENFPIGAKILQKSYASRVITHFVSNFVAMATSVSGG